MLSIQMYCEFGSCENTKHLSLDLKLERFGNSCQNRHMRTSTCTELQVAQMLVHGHEMSAKQAHGTQGLRDAIDTRLHIWTHYKNIYTHTLIVRMLVPQTCRHMHYQTTLKANSISLHAYRDRWTLINTHLTLLCTPISHTHTHTHTCTHKCTYTHAQTQTL